MTVAEAEAARRVCALLWARSIGGASLTDEQRRVADWLDMQAADRIADYIGPDTPQTALAKALTSRTHR